MHGCSGNGQSRANEKTEENPRQADLGHDQAIRRTYCPTVRSEYHGENVGDRNSDGSDSNASEECADHEGDKDPRTPPSESAGCPTV